MLNVPRTTRIFEKYGEKKFIGVVTDTDNDCLMEKCREELKKLFEWLLLYPCAAHGFQLLIYWRYHETSIS